MVKWLTVNETDLGSNPRGTAIKGIKMSKPKLVLISDIHFTIPTLELAKASLVRALNTAEQLQVPLVIAGDTLDSKAIMRAECVNELINIFQNSNMKPENIFILVGNHDRLNEKSRDHSLRFLNNIYASVISGTWFNDNLGVWFIAYQNDKEELKAYLNTIPAGSTVIIHQGVQTAYMGHYIQDNTSLPPEAFKGLTVFSGHYHKHQTVGTVTYIGNPYTLNFGEATDGPKGFQILNDDNTLTFVPTNLRKHVVVERTIENVFDPLEGYNPAVDLLKFKLTGTTSDIDNITKKDLQDKLGIELQFKFDKIRTDVKTNIDNKENMTNDQLLDKIIDGMNEPQHQKDKLKYLWRSLLQ